jgi:hypothetical protein
MDLPSETQNPHKNNHIYNKKSVTLAFENIGGNLDVS